MMDYPSMMDYPIDPHAATEQTVGREAWSPQTDAEANYCLQKIFAAQAIYAQHRRTAEAEIGRVTAQWQAWLEARQRECDQEVAWRTGLLRGYAERLRDEGAFERKKSYPLPLGTLRFRVQAVDYQRTPLELLGYARPLGLIKTREEADWTQVKARIDVERLALGQGVYDVDGQPIPGVTVTRLPGDVFEIRLVGDVEPQTSAGLEGHADA